MGFGEYPAEYNPRIHGPYNPARYYGKPDTNFSQTKIGDLGRWLSRRSYHPQSMAASLNRGYWRWAQKYLLVRKGSVAPIAQAFVGLSLFYYFYQYKSHTTHRHAKYH